MCPTELKAILSNYSIVAEAIGPITMEVIPIKHYEQNLYKPTSLSYEKQESLGGASRIGGDLVGLNSNNPILEKNDWNPIKTLADISKYA